MNRRSEIWLSTIRVSCFWTIAAVCLSARCSSQEWSALQQTEKLPERLHGVLSRQRLIPPLRSASTTLRYSPDGRYLLFQDPSGIFVLSREPLKVLGYIDAPNTYVARFSGDSQSIVVVSLALSYQRRAVRDGQLLESKQLPIPDGCVDAQISPDAELFACYRPNFSLGVLKLSTGQWIFSDVIQLVDDPHSTVVPIPLDIHSPFAGPFGFTYSSDMKPLANRAIYGLPMTFSTDGSTLIAGDERDAIRVDLAARRKTNLPSVIRRHLSGTVAIQNEARVLLIPVGNPSEPSLRSLTDGSLLSVPNFRAASASLATDSRYALLYDSGVQSARVFDLEGNRQLETPKNIAVDVRGGELALATDKGDLFLYRPPEREPFASVLLPLEGFPLLRSAMVAPGFDKLAIAVDGAGALFEIETGQRTSDLPQFSSANFENPATAFLLIQGHRQGPTPPPIYSIDRVDAGGAVFAEAKNGEATFAIGPQEMLRLDLPTAKTSAAWTGGEDLLRSGGPVLFEYSFETNAGRGMLMPQAGESLSSPLFGGLPSQGSFSLSQVIGIPFRLRALDPATGKELWSRSFTGLPPIPFADPQGDRLVLSWKANGAGARGAAKHGAVAKDLLKRAKLTDHDSFLEALDAQSGKSVGGVLVRGGNGPADFDTIFSSGDAIIFSRDAVRVYVYSMLDGQLKAKLVGIRPSATAKTNLLALETDSRQLTIYDLSTGAKLDNQIFSDPIVYAHFSADGQRLLVLTEDQTAFVLDMNGVRATH
jgi:outer membrane protein assembly factor BamB